MNQLPSPLPHFNAKASKTTYPPSASAWRAPRRRVDKSRLSYSLDRDATFQLGWPCDI